MTEDPIPEEDEPVIVFYDKPNITKRDFATLRSAVLNLIAIVEAEHTDQHIRAQVRQVRNILNEAK